MEPGYTPAPGYGELLPSNTPLVASDFDAWFFLFWAGLLVVVIALPWARERAIQHRDLLPLLALGAGLLTSLGRADARPRRPSALGGEPARSGVHELRHRRSRC